MNSALGNPEPETFKLFRIEDDVHINCPAIDAGQINLQGRAVQSWSAIQRLALVSSTYDVVDVLEDTSLAISDMWSKNSTGPRTVPCGTQLITGESGEILPSTTTSCCLWDGSRKDASQHPTLPRTLAYFNL